MKKLLKITLALMMALCLQLTSFNSVHALNNDLSKAGTYQVPIKSLTSAAPIPAVQTAFAKAFGDSLEVTVNEDGSVTKVKMKDEITKVDISKVDATTGKEIEGAKLNNC